MISISDIVYDFLALQEKLMISTSDANTLTAILVAFSFTAFGTAMYFLLATALFYAIWWVSVVFGLVSEAMALPTQSA